MNPEQLYWNWVRSEAALIKADGCSKVLGFHVEECFQHDLAYYYGKDPTSAYLLWLAGDSEYWKNAALITRAEADARFRRGQQSRSKFGFWSPMAAWRWVGVRIGGKGAWDKHRARELADGK